MKPALTPLSMVTIVVIVVLAFWFRSEIVEEKPFVHQPVVKVASPDTPGILDRSLPGVVATPEGKRVMTEAEREKHRETLRTQLIAYLSEAETLLKEGAAMVAAGKPNSTIPRINEIMNGLKPIAADSVFPDVQTAASNGIEALKVTQTEPITKAASDAKALPQ